MTHDAVDGRLIFADFPTGQLVGHPSATVPTEHYSFGGKPKNGRPLN